MYAPLLANRYLTSRVIPFIAVAAVALCVALVIIVVSVMSGFLEMVRNTGRTMTGDVVVSRSITGIPYYPELVAAIEALPEAAAATPVVETFGLLQMPYGSGEGGRDIEMIEVWGIDPASFDRATDFGKQVYWRAPDEAARATLADDDPRLDEFYDRSGNARTLMSPAGQPGVVLGIEISPFNSRSRDGSYRAVDPRTGAHSPNYFMPDAGDVILTLVPVTEKGSLSGEKKRKFAIVNEFQSGLYQIDANRILMPIADAQAMLQLDEAPLVSRTELGPDGRPLQVGVTPARATTILVRAEPGTTPESLRDAVRLAYESFERKVRGDQTRTVNAPEPRTVNIATWEERLADFIGPVEKERELMRILFSIVYIVCAALVLAIFWAIVQEKTRDIGILRAVGASRVGVLWIFLRYGLLIGVVGSIAGVLMAWGVVARINDIHDALGYPAPAWLRGLAVVASAACLLLVVRGIRRESALHTVLWGFLAIASIVLSVALFLHQGFLIWDPSVYYFSRIPSRLDLFTALTTAIGGIVFSVIGASIPAARAADTDPVQSLRYE